MDLITIAFSIFLVAVSIVLTGSHILARRAELPDDRSTPQGNFAWRRFRRRMQASIMIGLTGLAILFSGWLPPDPMVHTVYWISVLLWVGWIVLLAMADILATRRYFDQVQREQLVEQVKLQSELQQHRHRGNGHRDSS